MIQLVNLMYIDTVGGERISRKVLTIPLAEFTAEAVDTVRNELQKISHGPYFFRKGLRPIGDKDFFTIGKVSYDALSMALSDIPV